VELGRSRWADEYVEVGFVVIGVGKDEYELVDMVGRVVVADGDGVVRERLVLDEFDCIVDASCEEPPVLLE
jgi:hypothetical protein